MNQIQKIELACFSVAGFCTVVSPALAANGFVLASILVGGVGAAAIAGKAFLSSSPKDSPPPAAVN